MKDAVFSDGAGLSTKYTLEEMRRALELFDSESQGVAEALASLWRKKKREAAPPPKSEPRSPWRRVPEAWEPNLEHRAIARDMGVDFSLELKKFRDHHFQAPRQDADATFRNWLRNSAARSAPRNQGTYQQARQNALPPGWLPGETPLQRAARLRAEFESQKKKAE